MALGDHLTVPRFGGLFTHHGIDCGDEGVIHLVAGDPRKASVRLVSHSEFSRGEAVSIRDYRAFDASLDALDQRLANANREFRRLFRPPEAIEPEKLDRSPEAVVARAKQRLGERGYDLLMKNCEHFATWCKTGLSDSRQVNAVWKLSLKPLAYQQRQLQSYRDGLLDSESKLPAILPFFRKNS